MYFLGLGLLVLSTWYLLKLFDKFNDDPLAKKEISDAWAQARKEAKGKNPFASGRIQDALNSYKADMKQKSTREEED
tara:strand:- start:1396 stop:1626 length:231 start_codon:yes stop_codon:yes gene_type:complete